MSDSEDVESMDLLGDNDGPREGQWNGRPDDRIFTEPSVLDGLIDSPMPIEDRLQLQSTCKAYRDRMAVYWTKGELVLHPHDCTHRTANYVLWRIVGTDFKKGLNPGVQLVFCDNNEGKRPTDERQRDTVLPKEWLAKHETVGDLHAEDRARRVPYTVEPTISMVRGFFLGRLWARLTMGKAAVEVIDEGLIQFEHPLPRTENFYNINKHYLRQMTPSQQAFVAGAYYKAAARDLHNLCDRSPSKTRVLDFHMLDEAAAQQLARLSHPPKKQKRVPGKPIPKPSNFLGLRHLNLRSTFNKLSHGLITPLLEGKVYTKALKHLDLSFNPLSNDERTKLIFELGNIFKFPVLEKLSLVGVRLDDADMLQLAPKFDAPPLVSLEVLQLSDNRFTGAGLESFMRHARRLQRLKTLDMSRLDIRGTDVVRFASWLVECAHWNFIELVDLRPRNHNIYSSHDLKLVTEAVKMYKTKKNFQRLCAAHNKRNNYKLAGEAPDLW